MRRELKGQDGHINHNVGHHSLKFTLSTPFVDSVKTNTEQIRDQLQTRPSSPASTKFPNNCHGETRKKNFFLNWYPSSYIYILEISTEVFYGQRSVTEHEFPETYENM